MLPYNFNKKLGYYKLDNEEYEYKVEALIDAKIKRTTSQVEFDFNNDFFSQVKWKEEPLEALDALYAERARQIREKYDYVIIAYSGGSDSWNILKSFLSNGLKVDEIITTVPLEATKNKNPSNIDYSPYNFWSEYHYVTKPDLEEVAKNHPEIKITVSDWSARCDKIKLKDGWVLEKSNSFAVTNKWSITQNTNSVWSRKNICYVVGHDKPRICYKNNKFYIYFLDFISHTTVDVDGYTTDTITTEFFYWAPESEKILRKQAHIIKKFFLDNQYLIPYITWPISDPNNRTFYEQLVKGLIYKNYNLTKFQVNKPKTLFGVVWDYLVLDASSKIFKQWKSSIDELMPLIPDQYLQNGAPIGFVSNFYEI